MATLSELIILWWLFMLHSFHFILSHKIMKQQKGKWYQGTEAIDEAFEFENTRSEFKCWDYREKWKAICQATVISISGTQVAFSDKVACD